MQWYSVRYDTRIVLWALLFVQLLLIAGFWVLQQGVGDFNDGGDEQNAVQDHFAVHFVKSQLRFDSASESGLRSSGTGSTQSTGDKLIEVKPISQFASDYVIFTESGDQFAENLTCFRQGIIDNGFHQTKNVKQCRCQPEWHGKDCGQPEILWRAFMTSKAPLFLSDARQQPHKVFYMITGHFYSLELLEIQVMELFGCVDYFIICNKRPPGTPLASRPRLKMNFATDFLDRILLIDREPESATCTPKSVYKLFKSKVSQKSIKPDDIFVVSNNDQVLNKKAIKYLKYYDNSPGLIRFRLKYNVYGFFWQHPESTRLGSGASTILQLEENYKSDPERLLLARKPTIIVGDLNHFGGWYCEYCYQPSEIVDRLQIDSPAIFPRSVKNRQIDSSYIQNLIASGLYVDGKLGLHKLHRFSDKYYAPEHAEQNGWRFDNILMNLFLTFDDDDDYEN
ncbi:unnamed protein product [Hermetia illucens]|uniref:Beta-1,4-mannosyl-glycoprotein 4-beta-N-acetylglucosaminyltransferase n=1 Tax=Hermetia illucens TaxID=343691 RepID=A0A7R8YNK7_HERIL|nr:beta-1,4-mannosyl-glycoprotein 4-beta-N-acetylglucosaminyltransferase [Hermetia illucens]XP_037903437.1 beta-1,4-mannosyl-glycoprotein 4-beta-N-acetylglucosaminyltransferase [Hermetia illucens]CAD7079683.1 unnamed protein product [Hermetia illucens]